MISGKKNRLISNLSEIPDSSLNNKSHLNTEYLNKVFLKIQGKW